MSASPTARNSAELSPAATVGLLSLFGLSGGLGYVWGGIGGAFFAGLGVTTTAAVAWFVRKTRAEDRTRMVESAPDLAGLAPGKALSVMGAMTGTPGPLSFKSELLSKLETIDETLDTEPDAALRALAPLIESHPRSPAVHLRHARALRAKEQSPAEVVSTAIGNALDGGMNAIATTIFLEFEAVRDELQLEDKHVPLLAKALELRGHADEAAWCSSAVE